MKTLYIEGDNETSPTPILIGENKEENDFLLKTSEKSHFWFHLDSFPSCHLVFKGKNISHNEIVFCAKKCLEHTKYKNMKGVYVCYTTIGNLKRTGPGEVEFISNKKVRKIMV